MCLQIGCTNYQRSGCLLMRRAAVCDGPRLSRPGYAREPEKPAAEDKPFTIAGGRSVHPRAPASLLSTVLRSVQDTWARLHISSPNVAATNILDLAETKHNRRENPALHRAASHQTVTTARNFRNSRRGLGHAMARRVFILSSVVFPKGAEGPFPSCP